MTVTATPSLEDLERTLQDQAQIMTLLREGRFGDFVKNYADAKNAAHGDLAQQVKDETQRVLAQWLRDNEASNIQRVNLDPDAGVPTLAAQKGRIYNKRALGAKLDNVVPNVTADPALYFQALSPQWEKLQNRDQLRAIRKELLDIHNSFGSQVPDAGGFLIPEVLRAEILQLALETAVVRPRARVIPMESKTLPIPMVDDTSHASSVFGGITMSWTEEGANIGESQAKFGRVKLDAKKLAGYAEVPNELLRDASGFGAWFDIAFPAAIAWFEDDAFLTGNGAGVPLGVLNAGNSALISQAKETGQAADSIVWENVIKMYSRMLPQSLNTAVWVASPDTFPELATMALSVGTGGSAVWLNNGVSGPPMTILGRPVVVSEKVNKLGDGNDLAFIDFSFYLIGDRQVIEVDSSEHYAFRSDETAFRIIERADGRPWLQSALTPANGGATLSPFVGLAERA